MAAIFENYSAAERNPAALEQLAAYLQSDVNNNKYEQQRRRAGV